MRMYGYGLRHLRLQDPPPTVTGCNPCGYAAHHFTAAGSTSYGCSSPHLRLQVQEKDVVMVIHEHGSMQLKDLVAEFRPLFGIEKEGKTNFMAIVKKVGMVSSVGIVSMATS